MVSLASRVRNHSYTYYVVHTLQVTRLAKQPPPPLQPRLPHMLLSDGERFWELGGAASKAGLHVQ